MQSDVGVPLAFVGRQAIFDRDLRVRAYELLYRDSFENRARFSDVTQAAAATLINAFVEIGLDTLVGDLPVYANLTADFLLGRYALPFGPERLVLEVLETVPVTPELVIALRDLRAKGYRVALDDFVLDERTRPLLDVADVIKIDVLGQSREAIATQYAALRPSGALLLAEKVSTREEMVFLHDLGFDLFQGFFLEVPKIVASKRLPHRRATLLQLLAKLYASADLREIERLLATDVGLTVRLLKLASSAASARGVPIGTIAQALHRLGTQQVAALVVLVIASGFDDKPPELVAQALIRAQTCAVIGRRTGLPADELFTAGLLSLLDALLDQPLDVLLAQLPVTPTIVEALAMGTTPLGRVVVAARAQDRGDAEGVREAGIAPEIVFAAWREAVCWSREMIAMVR